MKNINIHYSSKKPTKCPVCNSEQIIDIVYGLPAPKLIEKYHRGEVELGGCCRTFNDPQWICKNCRTKIFFRKNEVTSDNSDLFN